MAWLWRVGGNRYPNTAAVGRVEDRGTSMTRETGAMQKWHRRPLVIPSTRHVRLESRVDNRA
eukprot:8328646-Lingulodinium_polyedra.AAC.1